MNSYIRGGGSGSGVAVNSFFLLYIVFFFSLALFPISYYAKELLIEGSYQAG